MEDKFKYMIVSAFVVVFGGGAGVVDVVFGFDFDDDW